MTTSSTARICAEMGVSIMAIGAIDGGEKVCSRPPVVLPANSDVPSEVRSENPVAPTCPALQGSVAKEQSRMPNVALFQTSLGPSTAHSVPLPTKTAVAGAGARSRRAIELASVWRKRSPGALWKQFTGEGAG